MSDPIKVKVTTIGDSVGIILLNELVARLKIAEGDTLTLTETPNGYELTYDDEFDDVVDAARKAMRKYRNALRELAKR